MADAAAGDRCFDVIVVGAGAAGCVLAGRISERADLDVLLIEAGPDAPPGAEHPDILDPYPMSVANPRFSWPDLVAEVGADPGEGRPRFARNFLQGFGLGGGSNILGMAATRGEPADFDEWRTLGATGWGWDDVLPWFNRLERDLDFAGPLHGADGPIPVRRRMPEDWAPFSRAIADALGRRGYPVVLDYNADFRAGVSPMPMANLPDRRVSASTAYLTREVRRRRNLTILTGTQVERIELAEGRVTGVAARTDAGPVRFAGREIVVSGGAIHTPTLLMRSGIGPSAHLAARGIAVARDIAGVGRNLLNHPEVTIVTHLRRAAMQERAIRTWQQNCLRYSSYLADCPLNDMLLVPMNIGAWHALGHRIGSVRASVYKSYSQGTVELAKDPGAMPEIRFNLLDDPRDFERLAEGFRLCLELLAEPEVAALRNEVFFPDWKLVGRLNRPGRWTGLQTRALAGLLDIAPLRRAGLRALRHDPAALAADGDAVRRIVAERAQPVHHVSGTCRMGAANDPRTVVTPDCRVRGVEGLRVVDASIFPTMVRANTHFPVLMAAEKMADAIKRDAGGTR